MLRCLCLALLNLKLAVAALDHCHPDLLMYKLFTSTNVEYESCFVRSQGNIDSQLKRNDVAAERGQRFHDD